MKTNQQCCICYATDNTILYSRENEVYKRCTRCGHVSLSLIGSAQETRAIPPHNQTVNHHGSEEKLSWDFSDFKYQKVYKPLLKQIQDLAPQGPLLDIGCGNGSFVFAANMYGYAAYGIDMHLIHTTYTIPIRAKLFHGTVLSHRFDTDSFACITLWQVLEHCQDIQSLLREVVRILQTGGILCVSTPNNESLGYVCTKKQWPAFEPENHPHLFSKKSLSLICARHGLFPQRLYTSEIQVATVFAFFKGVLKKKKRNTLNITALSIKRMKTNHLLSALFSIRRLSNWIMKKTSLGEDIYGFFIKK